MLTLLILANKVRDGMILANPTITAPIIGASKPEQLDDSLKAAEMPLQADLKQRLDELTRTYRMGEAAR